VSPYAVSHRRTLLVVWGAALLLLGLALPVLGEAAVLLVFTLLDLLGVSGATPDARLGFWSWGSISRWLAEQGASLLAFVAFLWIASDVGSIVVRRRRKPQ
jgi:hypothetical protein